MSLCESELWPGPQTDIEAWHFHHGDSDFGHKLTLRHSLSMNKYFVFLDGSLVKTGRVAILQRSFQIQFSWGDNAPISAIIECEGNKGVTIGFTRKLLIAGAEIPSLNSILRQPHRVIPNVGMNAPARIGITDFRNFQEKGEDKHVTVYQLYVEPNLGSARSSTIETASGGRGSFRGNSGNSRRLVIVERRFSEFVILDASLRSLVGATTMTELNIPSLPPKVYNPLVDQASEDFLHGRREALESYLASVLEHVDRLAHPQELYTFWGLDPISGLSRFSTPLGGGLSGKEYDPKTTLA